MLHDMLDDKGSITIIVILILVVVTIMGISSINDSTTELGIAVNDGIVKSVLTKADGQANLGIELLEQCIERAGFASPEKSGEKVVVGGFAVEDPAFYMKAAIDHCAACDDYKDASTPPDVSSGTFRGNIVFGGDTELTPGSTIQMASGYEGIGGGAGGGGTMIPYRIGSQWIGPRYTSKTVGVIWRHVTGVQ